MKIETKYDIGQEVWFSVKGVPCKGIVKSISIGVLEFDDVANIVYRITNKKDSVFSTGKEESELFPSKEVLLKSL